MTSPLSGTRIHLEHGEYSADIASVGASIRTLRHRGRDLIVPFGADEVRPANRGALLAPWPNRVADGRYSFAGVNYQLGLTEPARRNAMHGLASWLDFRVLDASDDRAVLQAVIQAQNGYPFRLELRAVFTLDDHGLATRVSATNTGPRPAPFGTAPHPYLVAGDGRVDDWNLTLPAAQVMTVTEDRLLPTGLADVADEAGGRFDFRAGRQIGDRFIDHAFTALQRDASGLARVELTAADGRGVGIAWDAACPWVQVHTADQPDPSINRLGLAVEPMTCPPDAFNSGADLVTIEPGATADAGWTIWATSQASSRA